MNDPRHTEDRLRAEYFDLLPTMRRTLTALETEVNYLLLPVTLVLRHSERIVVRGRLKDCESAVEALRRRQSVSTFDDSRANEYSLRALPDLVGLRVLTFPQRRRDEVERVLAPRISGWTADPVPGAGDEAVALKYFGYWSSADSIKAEIQIVSLLIGLFWEVEHSAIYKPSPILRGVAESEAMMVRTENVHAALREFEQEFDRQIESSRT